MKPTHRIKPAATQGKEGRVAEHKLRDHIAEQLQQIRQSTSWKQAEIAAEIGRTQGQVSRYELGQREIPADDLARIARPLQVPVQQFFPPDLWDSLSAEEVEIIQLVRQKQFPQLLHLVAEMLALYAK